ncbi:uncharacterized protein LOC143021787 isoform X3 [Oratosquilla oratoria]|uniref:uncharacterized protein LOC143021787 isoform X3 n=1 Tax=Oratosquilla oratoria TaxID=337810 RepID=UPI003F769BA5
MRRKKEDEEKKKEKERKKKEKEEEGEEENERKKEGKRKGLSKSGLNAPLFLWIPAPPLRQIETFSTPSSMTSEDGPLLPSEMGSATSFGGRQRHHHLRGDRTPAFVVTFSSVAVLCLVLLGLMGRAEGLDCVQCDSNSTHRACITEPPYPQPCEEDMVVCLIIREYYPAEGPDKSLVSVVRTCSPRDMGWDCEKGVRVTGEITEVCHESCNWDGCNSSSFASPVAKVIVFALTLLFVMPQVLLS